MSFPYKNPISPSQLIGQQSLDRTKTFGTNYSILSTGGYMEVFSLDQLYYTIPPSTYGPIEYSGNSIPITFSKGSGTTFSYDTLTLHPDNISSGRRKLGMMVYVYEENQLYQFLIDNYESLWTAATASTGTIVISDFGTTIKADSPENIAFMSGWTANTIDGVSGETYSTAVWKKLTTSGGGGSGITGGTFDSNTGTLTLGSSGGTITITGFTDTYTTGGTFNNITNTLELYDNSGNTILVSGFTSNFTGNTSATCITDLYVTNIYGCSPINVNDLILANSGLSTNNITATTITGLTYVNFDVTQTGTTSDEGRLFWDFDNRTLSLGMIGGPVQQIGQEQYYLVENQTGNVINDGSVVGAVGTTGASGRILVDKFIADGSIPVIATMGVLTQTLNNGDVGYVTSFGLVRNIDTTGIPYGETWANGDILYISTTIPGGYTKVKPIVPYIDVIIALVIEAGVNGSIFVRPNVYKLTKDPKQIIVAKQGGDFTSIKDAVDSITGSSTTNRYLISVGPGEFVEGLIDLTTKPYVSIVGSNIQTTLIIPSASTQNIVNIGQNNEISFLSFSGAGLGYAAIYCYDIGDFGQAHKCSFYDCDTNVWVEASTQDTKFYGEYLDFNGEYTYGTKVVSSGGIIALANMENYFNFPTGTGITYCNYATGSGATLSVFVGDAQSNGVSGSTAFYIQDGSELNASTITIDGFTYGIRNPNIGNGVRFDIDNASIVNSDWDLYVERSTTFGTFGGSANHQKIFTNSTDIYWLFLDIDDGELDITRKASVTFTDGSHTDFTTLIFEGGSMGLISGGSLSVVSGTTIQADGGFGYLEKSDNSGIVRRIDWVNNLITLSANTDEYIFINENSNLSSSGTRPNSAYNILLGRVVTNSTDVEFIDLSPFNAEHTSNRYGDLLSNALGPIYATGSIVTEGVTPFTLDVTSGEYYFATNQFLPSGGTNLQFVQYYRNGTGSTWITSATTFVNNTSYDNNGTLTGLTAGYYTKHTLYLVGDGTLENYFLVLGQNEYSTLVDTENALLPTPPSFFSDSVTQVANIYVQQGASGITEIEDIRPTIAFRAGGVNASSVHGNLLGLNADDHTQYLLVSGTRAMSGNLDMSNNNIVSAGTINGVTIQTHATRHQFGGVDQVGTTTPSPNAIPYADVSGTLDDWISTGSTSTLGKVKLSVAPISASNPIVVGDNDVRVTQAISGGSFDNSTDTLTLNRNDGSTLTIVGFSDVFVTGGTYSDNTFTYTNNTGGTFNVSFNSVTGLTSTGTISSSVISATTYQNLPPATPLSGTLILLNTQETEITGVANSTGIFTYTVAVNTYSRIMVESEVGFRSTANLNGLTTFELQYGGVTKRNALIEFDATGAGDQHAAGYTLKYSEAFTAGGVVRINTTGVANGTWTVESFRVYGII
jgi:hypothetical protein